MNRNLLIPVLVAASTAVATVFVTEFVRGPRVERVFVQSTPSAQFSNMPLSPASGQGNPESFTDAAKKATPFVVHIKGKKATTSNNRFDLFFGEGSGESSGSGVIVSADGYIMTNNHVIENTTSLEVTVSNRMVYKAQLVGRDPSTDLALLKIQDSELMGATLPFARFANSDALEIGHWVLAVGNPFNLNSTVTAGIVSAKGRNIDILTGEFSIEAFIQTDAVVNPGNSGGALVNTNGDLVGINTAIVTKTGSYEGYSFAVPSNLVLKVMQDLKEFGTVQRGFLGVYIQNITPEIAKALKLSSLDGVYLDRINKGGAAEKAGLKPGDIITHVNDVKVNSHPDLQEQVALNRPGDVVDVIYLREGKTERTKIVLQNSAGGVGTAAKLPATTGAVTDPSSMLEFLGGTLRNLNAEELSQYKTTGVLVEKVNPNSKLNETNMLDGFVIQKANDKPIKSMADLQAVFSDGRKMLVLEGFYPAYKDQGDYTYVIDK
jgi:Do/DeqQ family serine protease